MYTVPQIIQPNIYKGHQLTFFTFLSSNVLSCFYFFKDQKPFFFVYFWLCWAFTAACGLSWLWEQGLLSSCGVGASHCSDFSCFRAQALGCVGFSSCGAWAQVLYGTRDLPRPGIRHVSSALPGRFLTSGPPGKSYPTFND